MARRTKQTSQSFIIKTLKNNTHPNFGWVFSLLHSRPCYSGAMKTNVTKKENAEVEIKVVLPAKKLETYREATEKELLSNVSVDGFRKGKVPKDVAMKQVSSMQILDQMAQRAIQDAYLEILTKEDVKAIGYPQITITKIAEGSDLEFTILTSVMPDVKLGDYKKAAKKANAETYETDVTDEEVAETITNLRKMRAQQDALKESQEEQPPSWNDIKDEDLPELTDDWVKTLGNFENVAAFETKIKENLAMEKEAKNNEKRRIAMIEGILEASEIEVPKAMADYELDKMLHEFEGNIAMTGMLFDDYLKSINKTRDDYRTEWADQATKRAKTELALTEIARKENIQADDEAIESEVNTIMDRYQGQQGIEENNVRAYVATVLTHQKVFEFLEGQK